METSDLNQHKDWLAVYTHNSIEAHKLRQGNDHVGAKNLFEEALQFIEDSPTNGESNEDKLWKKTTLLYAILDCEILLQATPSEVMQNLHKYGENLRQMMMDISRMDEHFSGIEGVFAEGFTSTNIEDFEYAIDRFTDMDDSFDKKNASPELLEKLAMFYFFLSNYFQLAQLFFGFSTMMIKEGEKCKDMFRQMAGRTMNAFELGGAEKYKNYVNQWFGFYADIMDANYALYVKDEVFESNWEFSEDDIDMLWDIIESSLNEDTDDEAKKQSNQNAAAQAMETLMDAYSTYALMNIDNYEEGIKGLDRIAEAATKLKEPRKTIFYNYLQRAKIARKYMLDMRYNEGLFMRQLEPSSFFNRKKVGSEDTEVASDQYGETADLGFEFRNTANFTFSEQTTNAIDGLADRMPALSIPDEDELALMSAVRDIMPKKVYEDTEERRKELRKDKRYKEWEKIFTDHIRDDLKLAQIYISGEEGLANHMSQKWLVILEARLHLYEYLNMIEEDESSDEKPAKDSRERLLEIIEGEDPNEKLGRIEEMLLRYAERPKGTYFRQIVEIYILLGWVFIEKNENEKAEQYLCEAFNMLKDMGDTSQTLNNELRRAYGKLKVKESEESKESEIPTLDSSARNARKKRWNKAFCEILKSGDLGSILKLFTEKAREIEPLIVDMQIFQDHRGLKPGCFTVNDYANNGMYKTVIKIPQNNMQVLGIQSELPIPEEVLELLQEFLLHIFNLREANDFKGQLAETEDEKMRYALLKIILAKFSGVAIAIMPISDQAYTLTMREKFLKKIIDEKNLQYYKNPISAEIADSVTVLSRLDPETAKAMMGEEVMKTMKQDPRAEELDDILRISQRLTDFYIENIGTETDPEEEFKIKQFLTDQIGDDFTSEFIEFVQTALFHEDGIDFVW